MGDSGEHVAHGATASGEHVTVKVPRSRHWITAVPLMAIFGALVFCAYNAGGALTELRAMRVELHDIGTIVRGDHEYIVRDQAMKEEREAIERARLTNGRRKP